MHYWQRTKKEELKASATEYIEKKENQRKNFWYQLGGRSEEDMKELLELAKKFIDEPCKEKQSEKILANKNRVCWSNAKREIFNLCRKRDNIYVKESKKDDYLTITKYPPKSEEETQESSPAKTDTKIVDDLSKNMEKLNISQEEDPQIQIEKLISEEYGFTEIIDALSDSKLPIVGHNMIYDVMFMYHQFVDDLPATYDEFVKTMHSNFPLFYDTKLLSSYCKPIKSTWLKNAYDQSLEAEGISGNLKFKYDPSFQMYDEEVQEHEAAYDAYMTGVLFASVAKFKEINIDHSEKLDNNEEYCDLLSQKNDPENKNKDEVYKKLAEIAIKAFNDSKAELKNKPIEHFALMEQENKVVAVSSKNRVFYFGENADEANKSKSMHLKTDKILWIRFLNYERSVNDLFEACKDLGDIHIQKDDSHSFYIEFQTIYDTKKKKLRDMILSLEDTFKGEAIVSDFNHAEKYQSQS